LPVIFSDIFGSPNIGVYCFSNESLAIMPSGTPQKKIERFKQCLGVEVCTTNMGGSRLVGVLVAANSHGIILPHIVHEHELEAIEKTGGMKICGLKDERKTAFGNLILVNDYGAIVDPRFSPAIVRELSDVFDVEVIKGEINGLPYVGALAVATNKGVLAHPKTKEEEKKVIEEALKVPVELGTVNGGVPYIKSGLLANSRGAVAGSSTLGSELMAITQMIGAEKKFDRSVS